jgi:N-acetylglucosamine kinase-like BadF-type ATPase
MRYFLGIDGGQSSTTALLADETGRVTGYGRGGPCNHVKGPEGRPKFIHAIRGCFEAACAAAGLEPEEVRPAGICGGFSGGPADKAALLQEMFPHSLVHATTDALIGLSGATGGAPGLIAIAGTGSIAFGRNPAGRTGRAGGWGFAFGDEGGGFDLTRQALRAALRFEEGWGTPTALHGELLRETGAADANQLLHLLYTEEWPRPRVAGLSKLVDRLAREGDAVARDIVTSAAQQLAGYASAVRGMLFQPGEPAVVSWIGGVFQSELLLQRFRDLMELEEANRCAPPRYVPAAGGLIEAFRQAGLDVPLSDVPDLGK